MAHHQLTGGGGGGGGCVFDTCSDVFAVSISLELASAARLDLPIAFDPTHCAEFFVTLVNSQTTAQTVHAGQLSNSYAADL